MSLTSFLDYLLLRPLLEIYGAIFNAFLWRTMSAGSALMIFSLVVNVGLLPLYFQMERGSRTAKIVSKAVAEQVARMRAHFKGRELFYYIRAVHRQFGYHPISAVLRSGDLYLQVLIFATVFRFIDSHPALQGVRFLDIRDLSQPDHLLFGVNVLPIVMTLTNVASAILYGDDKKQRLQAFSLAGIFLVLLYGSPSGLVLFWTCNNVFSLLRNLGKLLLAGKAPPWLELGLARFVDQE